MTKVTRTLNIELEDEQGNTTVFKIDSPKESGLTREQIDNAYAPMFQKELLFSRQKFNFTRVVSAYSLVVTSEYEYIS